MWPSSSETSPVTCAPERASPEDASAFCASATLLSPFCVAWLLVPEELAIGPAITTATFGPTTNPFSTDEGSPELPEIAQATGNAVTPALHSDEFWFWTVYE